MPAVQLAAAGVLMLQTLGTANLLNLAKLRVGTMVHLVAAGSEDAELMLLYCGVALSLQPDPPVMHVLRWLRAPECRLMQPSACATLLEFWGKWVADGRARGIMTLPEQLVLGMEVWDGFAADMNVDLTSAAGERVAEAPTVLGEQCLAQCAVVVSSMAMAADSAQLSAFGGPCVGGVVRLQRMVQRASPTAAHAALVVLEVMMMGGGAACGSAIEALIQLSCGPQHTARPALQLVSRGLLADGKSRRLRIHEKFRSSGGVARLLAAAASAPQPELLLCMGSAARGCNQTKLEVGASVDETVMSDLMELALSASGNVVDGIGRDIWPQLEPMFELATVGGFLAALGSQCPTVQHLSVQQPTRVRSVVDLMSRPQHTAQPAQLWALEQVQQVIACCTHCCDVLAVVLCSLLCFRLRSL